MIRFTEDRRLLDDSLVGIGDEKDFGPAENAAFVNNGVAVFVTAAPEPPTGEQAVSPDAPPAVATEGFPAVGTEATNG